MAYNALSVVADSRSTAIYPSDGRVAYIEEVVAKKITAHSEFVFSAISGNGDSARKFVEESKFEKNVINSHGYFIHGNVENWFQNSTDVIQQEHNYKLIFGGLSSNKILSVYSFDSEDQILGIMKYDGKNMVIGYFHTRNIVKGLPGELFGRIVKEFFDGTPESIVKAQKELNYRIADLDETVDKITSEFIIDLT
ncbi:MULTISPECIES: hypothetical protein [Paenibacillus]|uniref:hypothetical protein n=1 Tax=Paenibacillus TaxID=44249 RepID=UPI00096CA3D7|nr:hypothetical protein [Paenibacillus odorifer]OMD87523.1 hypothetical protein BSK53_00515 [Paenibacillus odorifer]